MTESRSGEASLLVSGGSGGGHIQFEEELMSVVLGVHFCQGRKFQSFINTSPHGFWVEPTFLFC